MGAFANQDNDVGILQAYRQLTNAFDGIGIDLGLEVFEFGCAVEFANRVLVVVKNHNIHPSIVP